MLAPLLRGAHHRRLCCRRQIPSPCFQFLHFSARPSIDPGNIALFRQTIPSISTRPFTQSFTNSPADNDVALPKALEDVLEPLGAEPKYGKKGGNQWRLKLGKLRNKKSGKTFRAKSTPLPVNSFGKPAEVIIINRSNFDRAEDERKAEEEAKDQEAEESAVTDETQVPDSPNSEEVAAKIVESLQAENREAPISPGETDVTKYIVQLRPEPSPEGVIMLENAELQALKTKLKESFDKKQLTSYWRQAARKLRNESTSFVKTLSPRWVITKGAVSHNSLAKRRKNVTTKAAVAEIIIREIWGAQVKTEMDHPIGITAQLRSRVWEALTVGDPSHIQDISKALGVKFSGAVKPSSKPKLPGATRNKQAAVESSATLGQEREKDLFVAITIEGTQIGVTEASKLIDIIDSTFDSFSESFRLGALEVSASIRAKKRTFESNLDQKDLDLVSRQARAVVSSTKVEDGPGSYSTYINISAASSDAITRAKQLLIPLTAYLGRVWHATLYTGLARTKDIDVMKALVPIPVNRPSPLHKFELTRTTAVSPWSDAVGETKKDQIIHTHLKQSVLRMYKKDSWITRQADSWSPKTEKMVSLHLGYFLKFGSKDLDQKAHFKTKTQISTIDPMKATFWPSTPNPLPLLRALGYKTRISVTHKVKLVLVPDFKHAAIAPYLPKLEVTLKVEPDEIRFQAVSARIHESFHDIQLPNLPLDLRFHSIVKRAVLQNDFDESATESLKVFIKEVKARLAAGKSVGNTPGPTILFPMNRSGLPAEVELPQAANEEQFEIKYLIADVLNRETVSFKIPGRHADGSTSNQTFPASFRTATMGDSQSAVQTLSLHMPELSKAQLAATKELTATTGDKKVSEVDEPAKDVHDVAKDEQVVLTPALEAKLTKARQKLFIDTGLWLARQFAHRRHPKEADGEQDRKPAEDEKPAEKATESVILANHAEIVPYL